MAVKADEVTYSSSFEKETWVGQTHQPWQATGLGETTLTKNTSPSKSEGTSPHGKEKILTIRSHGRADNSWSMWGRPYGPQPG